jgi:hypothetical protein
MKGYKAFNHDWTCLNNFQYEIGKIHEMNENEIQLCERGFHFCRVPIDILSYYLKLNCKYAEIYADGKILESDNKCVCSRIKIVKEITFEQVHELSSGAFIKSDRIVYYLNGKVHRSDGPAIERSNGTKEWYLDGKVHRLDGPAIERANGTKEWWIEGKKHRKDGPAYECVNGTKKWYQQGKLHRLSGPAIEYDNGDKEWYFEDMLHREDGPAIEYVDGRKEWFINGIIKRFNI